MRHFIVKMISTSTEKEEEYEGEIMGTDVERGFIDFTRAVVRLIGGLKSWLGRSCLLD
jgi:hypothetical protein